MNLMNLQERSRMKFLLLSLICPLLTDASVNLPVTLGQNVILNCEFSIRKTIWLMVKPCNWPLRILRIWGNETVRCYDVKRCKKYSGRSEGQLVIHDVSEEDLGIYHCIKQDGELDISDGTRVYSTSVDLFETTPKTCAPGEMNSPEVKNVPAILIVVISISLLILVLFVAVIYLLIIRHRLTKRIPRYANSQQICLEAHSAPVTRVVPVPNNGIRKPPPNPRTDPEYVQILPDTTPQFTRNVFKGPRNPRVRYISTISFTILEISSTFVAVSWLTGNKAGKRLGRNGDHYQVQELNMEGPAQLCAQQEAKPMKYL
ncbi:hypothetical protein DNTS_004164 [Danionella cerebrum]|uniref:Ig-like domain-containing protein n=1 Tax=Danionella cerebrum TaxID=2873325 RepID=A0A553QR96_9TELE|nr:hypothetical protein DNTS_004164 [Danionella translucida]